MAENNKILCCIYCVDKLNYEGWFSLCLIYKVRGNTIVHAQAQAQVQPTQIVKTDRLLCYLS